MMLGRPRSIYVHDDLYLALRALLEAEGRSVSAWFRDQAREYLGEGAGNGQEEEPDARFAMTERVG